MQIETPNNRCLGCNALVDTATALGKRRGEANDNMTMCLYCGRLMVLNADLSLRDLTGHEMIEAMCDPLVQRAEEMRRMVMVGKAAGIWNKGDAQC